ncbi:helix-turn-helix domain-containing protein [Streptococcus suis]|nr:helix-turn-helix domain-containing protein [Streptococcus suis]
MYRRLRELREDNDFTQKYVAKKLSFTHSAYPKIERGALILFSTGCNSTEEGLIIGEVINRCCASLYGMDYQGMLKKQPLIDL